MLKTPIDIDAGIERIGDAENWREIIEDYFQVVEGLIRELHVSISKGDAQKMRQDAHAIKGSSLELLAGGMAEISAKLEAQGRNGEIEGSLELLQDLEREFCELRGFISKAKAAG